MKQNLTTLTAIAAFTLLPAVAMAKENTDSLSAGGKGEERNVMLNASDATKPREIQIGLPSEDVNVYENGLPTV